MRNIKLALKPDTLHKLLGNKSKVDIRLTAKRITNWESKHQIVKKSKGGLTRGAGFIRNVWNGKIGERGNHNRPATMLKTRLQHMALR